jgi:hypothetical protein
MSCTASPRQALQSRFHDLFIFKIFQLIAASKIDTATTTHSTASTIDNLGYNDTQTATSSTSSITSSSSRKIFASSATIAGTPKVKKRGSSHSQLPPETKVKKNIIIQDLQNSSREALSHEGSDPVSK